MSEASEAIVTKAFFGARDGEIHGTQFNAGDKVSGDLARVAVKEGWAEHPRTAHKSPAAAAETSASASEPAAQAGLDLASEQTARSSPARRKGGAS